LTLVFHTHAERPDLLQRPDTRELLDVWPEFLLHDRTVNVNWDRLQSHAPEFQLYALDGDRVVAQANTAPVRWDGTTEPGGIDWAMPQIGAVNATTLCAVQVMIQRDVQGTGLSARVLQEMTALARTHDLDALIAPVRPTLKHRYPLIAIERYVEWRRDDGLLFDPWLRTHERLGATLLGVAHESMRVEAPVTDWESWTGMQFPEDGEYVVDGALVPVSVRGDSALYVEPNVWMRHPV
jgi:hypothetical protein